jgi:hypothetical protein
MTVHRPDAIGIDHIPFVGMCPEGHPHVMCGCGWRSEDHIAGEPIANVVATAAEHIATLTGPTLR